MGVIAMNDKERQRKAVFEMVKQGRITLIQAVYRKKKGPISQVSDIFIARHQKKTNTNQVNPVQFIII